MAKQTLPPRSTPSPSFFNGILSSLSNFPNFKLPPHNRGQDAFSVRLRPEIVLPAALQHNGQYFT
jgi:hypothetical protein